MRLNAPRVITWWIALIIGVVGVLGALVTIPVVSDYAVWVVTLGLALLLVATATKSL
jgi:hypothetical protein